MLHVWMCNAYVCTNLAHEVTQLTECLFAVARARDEVSRHMTYKLTIAVQRFIEASEGKL
jgi:hypothetical protein